MLTIISNLSHKFFKKIFGNHFENSGYITYVNNIQWFGIARIANLLLSLFTTIVVARILGPERFGIFSYVLSIVGIFSVLSNLGISTIVYKELTLHKDDREEIFGSALFLNTTTALITIIVLSLCLFFIHETWYVKSLVLLMSFSFITQPLLLLSFDFLKDAQGKYITIAQTTALLISSLLKIFFVYFFGSVTILIGILVIENLITGAIYIYQIKKVKRRTLAFKVSRDRVLSLFFLSLPVILYSAFSEIYARIDQIMLRSYIDIKTVGLYSASVRLTEIWYLVPNILLGALFPALANTINDRNEYQKRYNILFSILAGSALCISFGVFFLKDYLVGIIYGKDFMAASPILGVYIFSIFGFFMSSLIYQDLLIRGHKWVIALIPFLTALLNIFLNIFLIPRYGASGAAIATVISYNVVPIGFYLIKKVRF